MSRGKTRLREIAAVGFIFVGAVFILECLLRFMVANGAQLAAVMEKLPVSAQAVSDYQKRVLQFSQQLEDEGRSPLVRKWESEFQRSCPSGSFLTAERVWDPNLGNELGADLTGQWEGDGQTPVSFHTNKNGMRVSPTPREAKEDPFRVVLMGDSLTFGVGLEDEQTWGALLQALNPRLEVLSYAVPEYDLGQMYLKLRRTLQQSNPDMVVVAYTSPSVERVGLPFYRGEKPYFELQDGRLNLQGTPVHSFEEVCFRLQSQKDQGSSLVLWESWKILSQPQRPVPEGTPVDVAVEVLREMDELVSGMGGELMLVALPSPSEIRSGTPNPFEPAVSQRVGRETLDFYPLLKAEPEWLESSSKHYPASFSGQIAGAIWTRIQASPAWGEYLEREKDLFTFAEGRTLSAGHWEGTSP